ncbi:AFG1/ZapE family ATPase [Oceanimonas smirnovii]|uniref:AFG1/ZapE family ATPase n=1 Tax=Oceanimonas smirnovii TaxID=264574 RepID=UPI00376F6653
MTPLSPHAAYLDALNAGFRDDPAQRRAVAALELCHRRLPPLSRQDDGVRHFIALVDECYDRRIPLWLEADVPLDELYRDGALAFPFRRTLSRLREMQLARFGLAAESG